MVACGVCAENQTSWEEGTTLNADQFRQLLEAGYKPSPEIIAQLARRYGVELTEALATWAAKVAEEEEPNRLLCPTCAEPATALMPLEPGNGPLTIALDAPIQVPAPLTSECTVCRTLDRQDQGKLIEGSVDAQGNGLFGGKCEIDFKLQKSFEICDSCIPKILKEWSNLQALNRKGGGKSMGPQVTYILGAIGAVLTFGVTMTLSSGPNPPTGIWNVAGPAVALFALVFVAGIIWSFLEPGLREKRLAAMIYNHRVFRVYFDRLVRGLMDMPQKELETLVLNQVQLDMRTKIRADMELAKIAEAPSSEVQFTGVDPSEKGAIRVLRAIASRRKLEVESPES